MNSAAAKKPVVSNDEAEYLWFRDCTPENLMAWVAGSKFKDVRLEEFSEAFKLFGRTKAPVYQDMDLVKATIESSNLKSRGGLVVPLLCQMVHGKGIGLEQYTLARNAIIKSLNVGPLTDLISTLLESEEFTKSLLFRWMTLGLIPIKLLVDSLSARIVVCKDIQLDGLRGLYVIVKHILAVFGTGATVQDIVTLEEEINWSHICLQLARLVASSTDPEVFCMLAFDCDLKPQFMVACSLDLNEIRHEFEVTIEAEIMAVLLGLWPKKQFRREFPEELEQDLTMAIQKMMRARSLLLTQEETLKGDDLQKLAINLLRTSGNLSSIVTEKIMEKNKKGIALFD
jgi:hypothetical protein